VVGIDGVWEYSSCFLAFDSQAMYSKHQNYLTSVKPVFFLYSGIFKNVDMIVFLNIFYVELY
jgi:hypothetical protein